MVVAFVTLCLPPYFTMKNEMITTFIIACVLVAGASCSTDADYHAWRNDHKISTAPTDEERLWFGKAVDEIKRLGRTSPHAHFKLSALAGTPWGVQKGVLTGNAVLQTKYFSDEDIQIALNASKDWQMAPATAAQGAVTRVKNQGACGSCWAFGTVAAIEGMYQIKGRPLSAFSEQFILDCLPPTPGLEGCLHGDIRILAQTLAASSFALPLEKDYEYLSFDNSTHSCNETAGGVALVSSAWQVGTTGVQTTEDAMAAWVYFYGPIVVGVSSWQSAWQLYSSGIADCPSVPSSQLDHGVTIVGYGTKIVNNEAIPYWKIKNSWTPKWGDGGYIFLRRGVNSCGVKWINTMVEVM